jgi:hypothetical protein
MATTIITIFYIILIVALIFTRKLSSPLFDAFISIVFIAFAVWSFFAYQDSLDDPLRGLGNIIYLIAISIVALLIVVGIAFIQKRWFLTTPVVLLALFWAVSFLFESYRNSQKITNNNFADNFPQITQAIAKGDTVLFNKVVSKNKENFQNIVSLR